MRQLLESPRARGAGGCRNRFARDFILFLAGLIRFGDRARCAVPPRLFPSSCFGDRCGNTVGQTLASPLGGARPRGPGTVDGPRNIRTLARTMASRCGSAYPCATASEASGRSLAGLTDSGPGALRVVERSRLSCRFIKVRNVVRTRFFVSSVKGGLITATWDSFSAVPFTWAAISDRRTALEPPMTVSRRMPAQVCSTLSRK